MNKYLLLLLLALPLGFVACNNDDDDDNDDTEQELITTVELHFTGPGLDRRFEVEDLDGPGGNPPTVDTIVLPPLTGNINCYIHVYDRSKNPQEDITEEILEEDEEHLFVFNIQGADMTFVYDSFDDNGAPLGVETIWTTDQPGSGQLRVTLYHEPTNKMNLADPGGEVDVEVTFPVKIQ
ncbi:MAG: hypothetical protein SFV52_01480 [Saprospiraceae bacterium]|nr:hypothetical protein [Saprospiraceae bacterium]